MQLNDVIKKLSVFLDRVRLQSDGNPPRCAELLQLSHTGEILWLSESDAKEFTSCQEELSKAVGPTMSDIGAAALIRTAVLRVGHGVQDAQTIKETVSELRNKILQGPFLWEI